MNKLKIAFSVFLLIQMTALHAQSHQTALEYLNFVSDNQLKITKSMWSYTKAMAHSKSDRTIDRRRSTLIKTVDKAILKISKAKGFGGNGFKTKVLDHLKLNRSLLKNEYAKIIDMKAVSEQSYDYMEAYFLAQELADKKMEESQMEYEIDYYAFAAKNNIEIIESESDLSKKMKISNEVFKHYKEMYLIFFKVNINEIHLMDAIKTNDVNAIQQNSNALNQLAKEGLEILKSVELYKNDASLIKITQKMFEFYMEESENEITEITDFIILNEDFESIKNTFDKTPQRKRTKKQVDAFNSKVKEVNKSVKNYNATNNKLNGKRSKLINGLNDANSRFLAKHIPKE